MRPISRVVSRASNALRWNPLNQQFVESDTLLLLDPAADASAGFTIGSPQATGLGAFLNVVDSVAPSIVAGRFRQGIKPSAAANSLLWAPVDGVAPTAEGTFEIWANSTTAWASLTSAFLWILGFNSITSSMSVQVTGGSLVATLAHDQDLGHPGVSYSLTVSAPVSFAANVWVCVALTIKNGAVTLYAGQQGDTSITQVAQQTGYVSPTYWGASSNLDGIRLPGSSTTALTISDFRVSRFARTPGVAPSVTGLNSITVGASTGHTIGFMNGLSKPPTGWPGPNTPALRVSYPDDFMTSAVAADKVASVYREDKLLNVTPISTTQDAAHPTPGGSPGSTFFYDWQVVDRTLTHAIALGAKLYCGLGNNHQINGAATGPFTDQTFTTTATTQNLTGQVDGPLGTISFAQSVTSAPNGGQDASLFTVDGTAVWAYDGSGRGSTTFTHCRLVHGPAHTPILPGSTVHVGLLYNGLPYHSSGNIGPGTSATTLGILERDLVYHILVERSFGPHMFAWTLWNEPDQGTEWTAAVGPSGHNALYLDVMPYIKTLDPTQKLSGPEVSNLGVPLTTWVQPWLTACKGAGFTPEYLSWHNYGGTPGGFVSSVGDLKAVCATVGVPTPRIIIGELGWQQNNTGFSPNAGVFPWSQPGGTDKTSNPVPVVGTLTSPTSVFGQNVSALQVTPTTGNVVNGGDIVVTSGTHSQQFFAASSVAAGATTIPVVTAASNFVYPVGTPVKAQPSHVDFCANDFNAAYQALCWVILQQTGQADVAVHFTGNDLSIFDTGEIVQPMYNAMKMWGMIVGNQVISTTLAADPGLGVVGSLDGSNNPWFFLANLHYRSFFRSSYPITIGNLASLGVANGTSVTAWLVDATHSNAYDTLGATTTLQTTAVGPVSSGQVSFTMAARSVMLLKIGP